MHATRIFRELLIYRVISLSAFPFTVLRTNNWCIFVCCCVLSQGIQVCKSYSKYGLSRSVGRALARCARGTGFEPRLRHDFSPPVTLGVLRQYPLYDIPRAYVPRISRTLVRIRGQISQWGGICHRVSMCAKVKISGVSSSVGRALARCARGSWFESRLRHDFSQPVTVLLGSFNCGVRIAEKGSNNI